MLTELTTMQRDAIGLPELSGSATSALIDALRATPSSPVSPQMLAAALEEVSAALSVLLHTAQHAPLTGAVCGVRSCPLASGHVDG
jgi:hypothetical protein